MSRFPELSAPELVPDLLARAARLLHNGRPADAIVPLRRATLLEPANATMQHDLGLACLEAGHTMDAIAALQLAIAANPRYSDAYFRLGIALEKLGDVGGAIAAYGRATDLRPSLTEAWFRAGALVYMLGHRDEAIGCFDRAAATGGKSSFGRLGKARALLTADRNAEAEHLLRQITALEPGNAMAYDLLGNHLTEVGGFAEARVCFEKAIDLAPLLAGSYYELVRCRPVTLADNLLPAMEGALRTPGLEASQSLRLHLALGKAADDLGNYEKAMQHFDAADSVRRNTVAFDSAAFSREIDRLIAHCTPKWLAAAAPYASNTTTPLLILGMPRSGTTLVEQIISNHSEVTAGGELHFWNQRGSAWRRPDSLHKEGALLQGAGRDYLAVLRSLAPRAAHVTDKMPFNFLWAGLIHATMPQAVMIHCRRNPLDTSLSIHQTHFHPGLAFPTGGKELVSYYRDYQRLCAHWRAVLPADRWIEVEYEELTRTPGPVIRRLIAACGLQWDKACLRPESNPRAVRTPSRWQARQPIHRGSVARWRRYEPWLGPLQGLAEEAMGAGADEAQE